MCKFADVFHVISSGLTSSNDVTRALWWLTCTIVVFGSIQIIIVIIKCKNRNVRIQHIINKHVHREIKDGHTGVGKC